MHPARLAAAAVTVGLVFCLAPASPSRAALLEVDPDGGQPYTVLQDALTAADTGDTILLHPGLYRQWTERWHGGTYRRAVGFVESGVTILGVSHGSVISPPDLVNSSGLYSVTAESVTIRNLRVRGPKNSTGLFAAGRGPTRIEDCLLEECGTGILTGDTESRTWVSKCTFVNTSGVGCAAWGWVLVSDCEFTSAPDASDIALVVASSATALMRDSIVEEAGVVQVNTSGSALVRNVSVVGTKTGALVRDAGSTLSLERVSFTRSPTTSYFSVGIIVAHHGEFYGSELKLEGMDRAVQLDGGGTVRVGESSIIDWTEWAVFTLQAVEPPNRNWNFTGNWWGTADSTAIAGAIWDGIDDPDTNRFGIVDFWPAARRRIPTTGGSVGRVKGTFRPKE